MPFKSAAQRRLMYAAAAGRVKNGPSPSVAKKFIAHSGKVRTRIGKPRKAY